LEKLGLDGGSVDSHYGVANGVGGGKGYGLAHEIGGVGYGINGPDGAGMSDGSTHSHIFSLFVGHGRGYGYGYAQSYKLRPGDGYGDGGPRDWYDD